MKYISTIIFLALISQSGTSQILFPGNLVGVHKMEVQLADGVTMQQFKDHYQDVLVPAYARAYRGMQVYLTKVKRGECLDCLGLVIIFPNDDLRNLYFDSSGNFTEAYHQRTKLIQKELDAQDKLGKITNRTYTDFIIQ